MKHEDESRVHFEQWGDTTLGWRVDDFVRESTQFHSGENYESSEVQVAWTAWQASAVETRELCAQLVEKFAETRALEDVQDLNSLAERIRAGK